MKCEKILKELYFWTADRFYHDMTAFHECALYGFVEYMVAMQEGFPDFVEIYFDEKGHEFIEAASREEYEKAKMEDEDCTQDEYKSYYYDVSMYLDILFRDLDFLILDGVYNCRRFGDTRIEELMGINIDYYFELLPLDIQKKYQTRHITLITEVSELLKYISQRIHHGSLYKLFWENDEPINETRVQLILENIMDAYFYNQAIDITREAVLGNGKVDFKLYKNSNEEEKILLEIKMARTANLKKGYENQLVDYMHSVNYKNAFYLIVCYTDEEIEKCEKFIRGSSRTELDRVYINIYILDLRKRKSSSAL